MYTAGTIYIDVCTWHAGISCITTGASCSAHLAHTSLKASAALDTSVGFVRLSSTMGRIACKRSGWARNQADRQPVVNMLTLLYVCTYILHSEYFSGGNNICMNGDFVASIMENFSW